MTRMFDVEPGNGTDHDELPGYAQMLRAYHRSRAAELRAMVATLPLAGSERVLDVACGDGTFCTLLAERCRSVVGVDLSRAYLQQAQQIAPASSQLMQQNANSLAFCDGSFDLVWCAQSLFSLPDPLTILREMVRVARPGGYVAILENDSLHHLIMPWPAELELALLQAQFAALCERNNARHAEKFYVGRDLAGLMQQVGLRQHSVRTFAVERHAPLDADEQEFLVAHMAEIRQMAEPFLEEAACRSFDLLFEPESPLFLLRQAHFHLTHLEMLAVGQKPAS